MVSVANRLDVRIHECLVWRILKMLEGVMGWVGGGGGGGGSVAGFCRSSYRSSTET